MLGGQIKLVDFRQQKSSYRPVKTRFILFGLSYAAQTTHPGFICSQWTANVDAKDERK